MNQSWAFVDLDGTLLNKRKKIDNKNLIAIKNFVSANNNFVIATGRWPVSAFVYNQTIQQFSNIKNKYLICLNGANIFDLNKNQLIYESAIDNQVFASIIDNLNQFKISLWIYSQKGIEQKIIYSYKIPIKRVIGKFNYGKIVEIDKQAIKEDKIYKMLAFSYSKQQMQAVLEWLKLNFKDKLSVFEINSKTIEITAVAVSKGNAILKLQEIEKFSLDNTIAFGDSANDLSMFQVCNRAICFSDHKKRLTDCAIAINKNNQNFDTQLQRWTIGYNPIKYDAKNKILIDLIGWEDNFDFKTIYQYENLMNYLINQNHLIISALFPQWYLNAILSPLFVSKNTICFNQLISVFDKDQLSVVETYYQNNKDKNIFVFEYEDNNSNCIVYKDKNALKHFIAKNNFDLKYFKNQKEAQNFDINQELTKPLTNFALNELNKITPEKFRIFRTKSLYFLYSNKSNNSISIKASKKFKIGDYQNINQLLYEVDNYLKILVTN
ncbi:MAG: Cof-type HAD-IIB family hydrolase [Malacoplasma sp.]|nr:Cof-type HAD-IIB family hydrolase [Malacoplasma sp.]